MTRPKKPPELCEVTNQRISYKELSLIQKLILRPFYRKYMKWLIADLRFREGLNLADEDLDKLSAFIEGLYSY